MKILELHIHNYQQFENIYLDFTDGAGKAHDRICFIGRNGTGKSTILNILNDLTTQLASNQTLFADMHLLVAKINHENKEFYYLISENLGSPLWYNPEIDQEKDWISQLAIIRNPLDFKAKIEQFESYHLIFDKLAKLKESLQFQPNADDLIVYAPAESDSNSYKQVSDVPETDLNKALELFKSFPFRHTVSDDRVSEFWRILIYLIKKRENEREQFENREQNLNKTKRELIEEFDKQNPKILEGIAHLWNRILSPAGLEFDLETASNPVQLTDNLQAYIRLKKTKQHIGYNQLSTGIRNFIFRVGHIYSLYFNRNIQKGFLFLDEPENSLFPDFLFDLVETYQEIIQTNQGQSHTQFFISTHNPIVAAQFEPSERIVLEWNANGSVDAYKGLAPIGDDPNDILTKDFKLKNVMGRKGQAVWEEYVVLRKQLKLQTNKTEKQQLIARINKIGQQYNFDV